MPEHLYAVLADIHANYEALRAVEAAAEQQAGMLGLTPEYICLGDVVDYGPQPNECMEWVQRHNMVIQLQGNHDRAVAPGDWSQPSIDRDWWPMVMWTRFELQRRLRVLLAGWQPLVYGSSNSLGSYVCFHGYPDEGVRDNYTSDPGSARSALGLLETRHRRQYGLFGHSHHQVLYERRTGETGNPRQSLGCAEVGRRHRDCMSVNEWHQWPSDRMALLNPGSVGQPRRRSEDVAWEPHAAYALLHSDGQRINHFQWRRVNYQVEQTIERLRGLTWLDARPEEPSQNGCAITKAENRTAAPEPEMSVDHFTNDEKAAMRQRFGAVCRDLIKVLSYGGR